MYVVICFKKGPLSFQETWKHNEHVISKRTLVKTWKNIEHVISKMVLSMHLDIEQMWLAPVFLNTKQRLAGDVVIITQAFKAFTFPGHFFLIHILGWVDLGAKIIFFYSALQQTEPVITKTAGKYASLNATAAPWV